MVELEVVFDFPCCFCACDMGVTIKCAGSGLAPGMKNLATVKVPCPTCQEINHLFFSPDGTLHEVTADKNRRPVPQPSFN